MQQKLPSITWPPKHLDIITLDFFLYIQNPDSQPLTVWHAACCLSHPWWPPSWEGLPHHGCRTLAPRALWRTDLNGVKIKSESLLFVLKVICTHISIVCTGKVWHTNQSVNQRWILVVIVDVDTQEVHVHWMFLPRAVEQHHYADVAVYNHRNMGVLYNGDCHSGRKKYNNEWKH